MANHHLPGKLFLLYLLLMFVIYLNFRVLADSEPVSVEFKESIGVSESDDFIILNRNQAQIDRLEEIIKNLTDLVLRLETRLSNEKHKINGNTVDFGVEIGKVVEIEKSSTKKFDPSWSEKFRFVSGVKLNSYATSVNLLPIKDSEGLSKYFAVGDNKGRVFVFLSSGGDLVVEFNTVSDSPVTTMVSYFSVYKNESVLVTGHENGLVLVHRVWEASIGEDSTSVHMEHSGRVTEIGEGGSSVTILEVHHVGRTRYIISSDTSGKIKVFRENGDLYGSMVPTKKPIAFLKQRLLFLTETGAGSLDLRTMKIKESACEGLNSSYVSNYVFDATERSKAYGFTSDGDLVQVLLLGDVTNFKCRVRSKKKFTIDMPISVQAIKGFLLVVNHDTVFVYNLSSQHYARAGTPKFAFSTGIDNIRSSFVKDYSLKGSDIPLLASDKENLFILGLGGGYVGIYVSKLSTNKSEYGTMFWSSPVLIFVLFLFGAWQFFSKKKEALTSWGPDDPLNATSVASGSQLDTSSRNGEAMELRGGGGLRGRRYVSPSRYPGGSANTYRPSPQDTNPRPPTDPSFRGSSELKFRGSGIESAGFPKRRESVFVNSQAVDDSS